eukprot:6492154-Amphidinium_carterae.3
MHKYVIRTYCRISSFPRHIWAQCRGDAIGNKNGCRSYRTRVPEDVARHSMTHRSYQPWCSVCRQARIREDSHRKVVGARREKHVQLGCAFVTEEATAREIGQCSMVMGALTGCHASLGAVERHHRELHVACRAMKHELERKLHRKLLLETQLCSCLICHVGCCLNRYSNYKDKTPHEHLYVRPCDRAIIGFGEYALAREPVATEQSEATGEHLVAVAGAGPTGVVQRYRTVCGSAEKGASHWRA